MGDAFITRRGGGGREAFAALIVGYPAGSVCICTKGSKTLRAKDTSGYFLFLLPEAGTWTVSCTKGDKAASQDVVMQDQYEARWVPMNYLFELLSPVSGLASGYSTTNNYNPSTKKVSLADGYRGFTPSINVDDFSTLEITGRTTWTWASGYTFDVGISRTSSPSSQADFIDKVSINGEKTLNIDLTNISGDIYVVTGISAGAVSGEISVIKFL